MEKDRIKEDDEGIEIDLYDYLRVIWRWRWLIVIGTIVVTTAAVFASPLSRQYNSHGTLRLSESSIARSAEGEKSKTESFITLPEYKIYRAACMDPLNFTDYLKGQKDIFPPEAIGSVEEALMADPDRENFIKPIYAYSEQETKTFRPELQLISAVRLSWAGSSPDVARKVVKAMGFFVKDTIKQKVLDGYVTQGYQEAYYQVQNLGSELSDAKFFLGQNEKKLADLQKIAQGSSGTERPLSREVVSVDQGGNRYLPPSTQVVATQVEISDTKLGIAAIERELKINQVKLEFFTRLKGSLPKKISPSLLNHLEVIKEEFFREKDVNKDEILIVRNEVFADFARFSHQFNDVIKFISGPTLSKRAKPPRRMVVVGVAFGAGLFFFVFLAFFVEFIQLSKQRERSDRLNPQRDKQFEIEKK